ncbi:MAG TPA: hypothetical protein VH969_16465 [Actinophytocola sp.]|jgi:hypothetical protein|uniref:hypothetical protein n=1 Tax=Actinophytocola sp. TaxID=1872138 RepID=UPI002F95F912
MTGICVSKPGRVAHLVHYVQLLADEAVDGHDDHGTARAQRELVPHEPEPGPANRYRISESFGVM